MGDEKKVATKDLFSTADTIKTPHQSRAMRFGKKTMEMVRFLYPPKIRNVGWWALVSIVVLVLLVHMNDWTDGVVARWAGWFWNDVWNRIGIVPFAIGGFLFRFFWPVRERK